jgi:hypothetical protein
MIVAFMATTVTHNPKSMLKMHVFQEGNIRLMEAEINLEGTSAGGCVRICTRVYCNLLGRLDVEESPSGLCALDSNKDNNKHYGMLRATRISSGRHLTNSTV